MLHHSAAVAQVAHQVPHSAAPAQVASHLVATNSELLQPTHHRPTVLQANKLFSRCDKTRSPSQPTNESTQELKLLCINDPSPSNQAKRGLNIIRDKTITKEISTKAINSNIVVLLLLFVNIVKDFF